MDVIGDDAGMLDSKNSKAPYSEYNSDTIYEYIFSIDMKPDLN